MTPDRDDRHAAGQGEGEATDQGAPPSIGARPLRTLETAELLHNPRAHGRGRRPSPTPIPPASVTLRARPARARAAADHDATDHDPPAEAIATSVTMPGHPGTTVANEAVTVPAFSRRNLSGPSADEIAARVRDRAPAFPLPSSDHYEYVRFLGEGGMGKVFLARDRRLGRQVAIKFVRGDSRDHTLRLLAEARAQAQVNHDRVCKVYEVDEVDGQVYIAMQYIDGVPLGALTGQLTVEQRVMVMRDASEGVHAAHRVGIIHRDLNPNNIMVERDHDGRLRSYVMDFGLARDRKEGATETGTVMGTPHYMSPEQARGEVGRLDRRADIYSLGASLYVILTGQQAIPGDNGLVVLNNIQLVEPRRLRAIDPDIPVDLEAITLRCLEKERSARYDSARALAEDLGRFLDGEPVQAQRASVSYRLRRRIRKHWRVFAAAAMVLAILGAVVAWGVHARRESQRARRETAVRERLAREFTERVEGIEASARYSALARAHDIRADRQQLLARMDQLAVDVALAGPLARGPGHYAIGRGLLALGDRDRARAELESAWQGGYQEPRVAYALAPVLSEQYQHERLVIERTPDDDQREARKRASEQQYRDQALAYLARSQGGGQSTEYVAALIASCEERYGDALAILDAMGNRVPWFYEASHLRGDIFVARASAAARIGDRARALADFEAGRTAYAAAVATGESVPDLHNAQATLEQAVLDFDLYDQKDVDAPFARGVAATERALAVLPDHVDSLVSQATLYRRLAEFRSVRGTPIDDLLERAIVAGKRAVEVKPDNATAWAELSRIYWTWANDRQHRSQDPNQQLGLAIEASDRVAEAERDTDFYKSRGLIFKVWADYQDSVGADSQANRDKAISAYESGLAQSPRDPIGLINLGANYLERASAPRNADPARDLTAAGGALDRALAVNPRHAVAQFYRAKVDEQLALRALATGGDPRPDLARALEHYRAGIAINQALPFLYNGAGIILLEQATDAWERGGDPTPLLDEAGVTFARAIAVAPDQWYGFNNVGEVERRRAKFQRAAGRDPGVAARAAAAAFERVVSANADESLPRFNLGDIHLLLAADALERAGDPERSLTAADAAFAKMLAQNPTDGDAHMGRAAALGLRAQTRARRGGGRDQDFVAAADAFVEALALTPDDQDARLDAGQFYLAWSTWSIDHGQSPAPALARGLAVADELLAARPTWASALVLRGSLLALRAQTTPDTRAALASRAVTDFAAGLAANPHLETVWGARAKRAQQLAAP